MAKTKSIGEALDKVLDALDGLSDEDRKLLVETLMKREKIQAAPTFPFIPTTPLVPWLVPPTYPGDDWYRRPFITWRGYTGGLCASDRITTTGGVVKTGVAVEDRASEVEKGPENSWAWRVQ